MLRVEIREGNLFDIPAPPRQPARPEREEEGDGELVPATTSYAPVQQKRGCPVYRHSPSEYQRCIVFEDTTQKIK